MNEQEVFDKVITHLRQQSRKSLSETKSCAYHASNGDKCAVGCLIPENLYSKLMEDSNVNMVAAILNSSVKEGAKELFKTLDENEDLLVQLQRIHDHSDVKEWERLFNSLARESKLTFIPKV